MNYAFQELAYLAEILGPERPEILCCLEKAARNPALTEAYVRHFQRLAKNEGFLLHDLPLFSTNLPMFFDEKGIYAGSAILGNGRMRKLFASLDSFGGHSLVSGQTTIGKSTLIKSFIPQFVKMGIAVWIFDYENEYKSLLRSMNPDEIIILDTETDKDNFLEPPPLTSPEEWKAKWRSALRELWLREGGINLVDAMFGNLYENSGVFSGSENYPTIVDVMSFLRSMQFRSGSRYFGYHEGVINRFGGLHDNLKCLRCREGFGIQKRLRKCVVYNMRGIADDIRHFYINLKTLRVMTYLEKLPPQGLKLLLIIDEAHKLYNKEIAKKYDLGEPMVFSNARTFAKRGIGCIYLDQIPSELPSALFGNVNNRFIMRLGNGDCIKRIARAANLRPEQSDQIPLLPIRHCLLHSGEFPSTVLFEVPELRFEYVNDEEVRRHMENVLPELEYTPIVDAGGVGSDKCCNAPLPGEKRRPAGARPNKTWTDTAKSLAAKGYDTLTHLNENLGNITPWLFRRIMSEMERQELIELCPISLGTRGNPKTFAVLRPKGAEFIGLKFDDVKLAGKGSTEHVILQNLLAEEMKNAGKTVAIEHSANGKAVDIAEIRPDGAIAYEVELEPAHPHVVENVLRDMEAGFDEVVVITRNQASQNEAKDQIYKTVPWEKLSRLKFKLLREFL